MTDNTPHIRPTDGTPDWEVLARYLAGESPAGEAEAVRQWLATRPESAELLAALDGALDRVVVEAPADLDVEGALRRTRARFDEADVVSLPERAARPAVARPRRRTFGAPVGGWSTGLRVAAGLVLLIGGALVWQQVQDDESPAVTTATERVFATAVGQRDSTMLSDGTRVVLGAGSQLTVAAGYGAGKRDVSLRGEAYFAVRHDSTSPFVVRAGDALVRDIGTAFAVHSDRGDGVRVVVTSGAVSMRAASATSDSVLLHAGDRALLEPDGRIVAQRAGATDDDLAWRAGRLVFRDAPIAQVAADLRRWYGIELRVSDSALAGRHVTASFTSADPAERVLDVIALALGARVERRADTVILRAVRAGGAAVR